jgi:hypothetical protein
MGNWKFFLANSSDMSLNADITGIARSKQLTLAHNRSGNCTFNLPLSVDTLEYSQTNQKCVIAMKNNNVVWSGPIWSRSIDLNAEKIEVNSVGWFEILMYRFIWESLSSVDFSAGADEGQIAFALLNLANSDVPTWITAGTESAGSTRKVKYEIWQSIGEEIINLSDTEDGFDIYIDPVTRQMNLTDADEYADRTEIPFGYNWGPNNISNLVIEENGGEMRNRIQVVGADNNVWVYDADGTGGKPDSQGVNNMLTEIIQVTEKSDSTVLQAIANAQGAIKQFPPVNYDLTLKPQGPGNPYEIFEDYNIGDKIYITANKQLGKEAVQLTHEPRIFGATIDIGDDGVERVSSLQTQYSGN